MDNLTHSLIGAAIGQTGLKRLSGLGMPTLIIAANIPDIDAACFFWLEGQEHLGFRRGITHGPVAMIVLPLLLTAIMVGFDRWQVHRGKRPSGRLPVRPFQLYILALIGCISHPAFDWLNNYGIRLLEPFSSRWFYGDSVFIIDVWMWALLIGGYVWSRVGERRGRNWMRRGRVVLTGVALYVFGNSVVTGIAESQTATWVRATYGIAPELVVASPAPLAIWQREMLWRGEGQYGSRIVNLSGGILPDLFHGATVAPRPDGMSDPRIAAAASRSSEVRAFLFWARMPILVREPDGRLVLRDQRFANPLTGDRFLVPVE
jgi:inner membrane protein